VNAPFVLAIDSGAAVEHIAQDLRAEAHRVPEDLRSLMRSAALVCDAYLRLSAGVGDLVERYDPAVLPAPILPPGPDPRRVKGAPCV
jgi:hypothetical protein